MITNSLSTKCSAVVEKLLDELLPRESIDLAGLEPRWREVTTTVKLPVPVWAAHDYLGRAAELIKLIKFGGRTDLIAALLPATQSNLFATILPAVLPAVPIFVPIPQSRSRFMERGYNQAELISDCLARYGGGVVWPLLRERYFGPRQHFLTQTERLRQQRHIMVDYRRLKHHPKIQNRPRAIVLVDDIVTTGATLAASFKALTAADLRPALALTVAFTPVQLHQNNNHPKPAAVEINNQ